MRDRRTTYRDRPSDWDGPKPAPLLTAITREKPSTEAWNCAKSLCKTFNDAGFNAYLIPPAKSEDKALHVRIPTQKSLIKRSVSGKHYLDFRITTCDLYTDADKNYRTGSAVHARPQEFYCLPSDDVVLRNMPDDANKANAWLQGDAGDHTEQVAQRYIRALNTPGFR